MTTFDARERMFENKYAHDLQMDFNTIARTNKLLGLWAAQILGLSSHEASRYAMGLVEQDVMCASAWKAIDHVLLDLRRKGLNIEEYEVLEKYEELHAIAQTQISTE